MLRPEDADDEIKRKILEQLMAEMGGMDAQRLPKSSGVTITIAAQHPGESESNGSKPPDGPVEVVPPDEDEFSGMDPRLAEILKKKKAVRA